MSTNTFRVVRIDNGPANPATSIESEHSTVRAALNALCSLNGRARKGGISPYRIQVMRDGLWHTQQHLAVWNPLQIDDAVAEYER